MRCEKRLQLGREFKGVRESDQDCCLLRCTVSLQGPPGMRTIKDDATIRLDESCGYQHASERVEHRASCVISHSTRVSVLKGPFREGVRGEGEGEGVAMGVAI